MAKKKWGVITVALVCPECKATNFFTKGIDSASGKAVQTLNKTFTNEFQKVIDKKYTE